MYSKLFLLGLLSIVNVAQATGLQRLFTTVEERSQLNYTRENPPPPPPPVTPDSPEEIEETVKIPESITFNGLLERSQGPTTVWVNGSSQPVQEGFHADVEAIKDDTLPIVIGKGQQEINLKPGQTINTMDGNIKEHFTGTVKVDKSIELD